MPIQTLDDYIKNNKIDMTKKNTTQQIQDITWNKKQKQMLSRYAPVQKPKKKNFVVRAMATVDDFFINAGKGFLNTVEGISDTISYGMADVIDFFGADDAADAWRDKIKRDLVNEWFDNDTVKNIEYQSYGGDMYRSIAQGTGNVAAMAGASYALGGGAGSTAKANMVRSGVISFSSSYGNTVSEALRNGEDLNTARKAGIIHGTAEAISEQFFDAIPGTKTAGWGEKLTGKVGSAVEKYFGSKTGKIALKVLNSSGEGFEEIISNMLTATGNDIMHKIDKNFNYGMEGQTGNIAKDLWKSATSKESWDAFISASLTSALTNGANTLISNTQKNNIIRSYAQENNMSVKEVKDMFNQSVQQKTEYIQQQQSGMNLNERVESEQQAKIMTLDELRNDTFVSPGTETQKYQFKESDNQKVNEMNQSLIEANANNTQATREVAKTAERLIKDLNLEVKFTNNEQIKYQMDENQLKELGDRVINGYVKDGVMYLNIDSNDLSNFTIGHETKHFFEASEELNEALNDSLEKFAREKGVYEKDLEDITKLYTDKDGNVVGDPKAELMANYVGQFFTDYNFVNNLSVKNPTLFQRAMDFFQKLYYKATGQQEKLMIKQINDNINKVYREYAKTQPGQNISSSEAQLLSDKTKTEIKEAVKTKKQEQLNKESKQVIKQETKERQKAKQKEENILPIAEKVEEKVEEKSKTNKKEFKAIIYSPKTKSPVIANVEGTTTKIEGIDVGIYKDGKNNWHVIDLDSKLSLNTGQESKKTRKAAIESAIKNIQENDIESLRKTQAERYKDIKEDKTLSNKDIQYSLSPKGEMVDNETGEKVILETSKSPKGNLMVLHNINESKFNGILDLGGIPVPSLAITNPEVVDFKNFGDGTLIFSKDTINPEIIENEVYDSDIYSTRFPTIDRELLTDEIDRVAENIGMSDSSLESLAEQYNNIDDLANRLARDWDIAEKYINDNNIEIEENSNEIKTAKENGIVNYLKDELKNIYGEKGIYNGKSYIDNYGNRRTFWQQHEKYNLDNLVRIMTNKNTQGSENTIFTTASEMRANMANKFNTLEEIKNNREKIISTEEMEKIKNDINSQYEGLEGKIVKYYDGDNAMFGFENVAEAINETAKSKSINKNILNQELSERSIKNVPDKILNETIDFLNKLSNLPTEYFEAKPQRAVGLNEIGMAVIPNNWSQEIKQRMIDKNINFVEYDPNIEGDRQRIENQFDDLKFSLSQEGKLQSEKYNDLYTPEAQVTTRLSDLKRKEVELPTEQENALKTSENEQKQGEKPTRREVIDRNRQLAREQLGDITQIKDKKRGLLYQINTMKRNLRDIMTKEQAQKMYDTYFKDITTNNAKIENDITSYNERIQKYNLNDKESTYTQMIGELKHNPETTLTKQQVDDFYNKNASKIDQQKCENAVNEFRQIYDELIEKVNDVLTDNGYKPIEYRKGYFPHFIEEKATSKLGKLAEKLGWKVKKGQLPTDIAGITDQFKPGKAWTSFSQQRTGDATDYNALKGLDNYLRGAMDVIYHTNDIQKLRALENEIRYQYSEKGVQDKIDKIYADDSLDMEEKNDAIANLTEGIKRTNLGNFATELRNYTDNLANKKSVGDRNMEQTLGRDTYSIMNNINGRVSANMVGANISSAITNFIPITQAWSQIKTKNLLHGMYDTIKASIKNDNFADKSVFLTNRTKQAEKLYNTKLEKINQKLGVPFEAIDSFTSNTIVRAKYYDNIAKGMSEQEAIANADEFAKDVMAGRSKGDQPTIFNRKNPLFKLFTAFQLEVNNQYGYMFKDIPVDMADEAKKKLVGAFIKMFFGAWLYNEITEKFTGRRAAFDPIDMAVSDVKTLTNEDMDLGDKIQAIVKDTAQEAPFVSGIMGGGRLPIQGAIPYSNPLEMITNTFEDIGKLDDPDKRKTAINNLKKEWSKPVYYLLFPVAGGQVKKTVEGLSMYDKDLPIAGSYTNSGKLRFEADKSILGKAQAAVFGQYASKNAREYFDKGYAPLSEKQIQEVKDYGMSVNEYREFNSDLKEAQRTTVNTSKGKYQMYTDDDNNWYWYNTDNGKVYSTTSSVFNPKDLKETNINPTTLQKASKSENTYDYVMNTDLPLETKTKILNDKLNKDNTITDKYGYIKYKDANNNIYWYDKNNDIVYDNKYRQTNKDISSLNKFSNTYTEEDVSKYGTLDEMNYAINNPDKYLTITNVTDYETFEKYKNDLTEIKSRYNNTNDRKQAVYQYINSLPLSVEQKLMLQKMGAGYSIKQYRKRLQNYINSLDLTKEEKESIDKVLFK